jgi:spore coat protein U-like protein
MKYSNLVKSALHAAVLGFMALGLISTSAVAQANPATTTFAVTAVVQKDCIVSAGALGFGNYIGAAVNASSTITVTCTSGTSYTVGLNAGLYTGGSVTNRQMGPVATPTAGGLNYSLLTGSYTGTNWGNTSGSWVSGSGNGAAQPLTVYGVLPAGQYAAPGNYTDTITATVTY